MKKTILFATCALFFLASCKKDDIQPSDLRSLSSPITLANPGDVSIGGGGMFGDFLKSKLVVWYAFDHSTVDSVNTSSYLFASNPVYVTDRKGKQGGAVSFTGQYDMMTPYITLTNTMSISVWMKRDSLYNNMAFVMPLKSGPTFWQTGNMFAAGMVDAKDDRIKSVACNDEKWHHLVATCDGSILKFYVDGVFQGTIPYNATIGMQQYQLGIPIFPQNTHWKRRLDDLRFYNRVLTQYDVNALYKL